MVHKSNSIVESGLMSEIWEAVFDARMARDDGDGAFQAMLNAHWTSPEFRNNRPFQEGREREL